MLVRLFMIQHDCGHGSFFPRRAANDWLGRVLGVFTLTPYDYFKRSHAMHHARTGNLDHRGIGDVATLTVREYQEKSRRGRLVYRLYRNPVILFGIGPAYLFILQYRLPVGLMRSGWRPWMSTMATNVALVAFVGLAIWALGAVQFLLVYVPVLIVASTIGVWLFYVQHQFEGAHWDRDENWSFHEAALHGSSHYDLPGVLRWLTANIGIHHIHHLSSRIPFYRLDNVLRDRPELRAVSRLTLRESLRTVTLALWDEDQRRLVTFRQARALRTGQPAAA
jgi:omega-6 fatty acid desaturase (delta-12 desaturase)